MTAAYYQGNKTFSLGKSEQRILKADEVRLEVAYCGICGTDIHIFHGNMDNRVQIPQVIGHEVSAVIAEIGSGVNGFKIGDKVTRSEERRVGKECRSRSVQQQDRTAQESTSATKPRE